MQNRVSTNLVSEGVANLASKATQLGNEGSLASEADLTNKDDVVGWGACLVRVDRSPLRGLLSQNLFWTMIPTYDA